MTDICRKCRKSSEMHVDIFAERHMDEPSLAVMLRECYNLVINHDDALPKQLCLDCVLATKNAFQLKRDLENLSTVKPEVSVAEWLFGYCDIDVGYIDTMETDLENSDAEDVIEVNRRDEEKHHVSTVESDVKENAFYEKHTPHIIYMSNKSLDV